MLHIDHNLRHLRLFVTVVETGSVTKAAQICNVTQPAVTQALVGLEARSGTVLFERTRQGLFPTIAGKTFALRVRRSLELVDRAADQIAPRLKLTATSTKLRALIAVAKEESFTLAANKLGVAQPTVHKAITQLESEAGRALFRRSSHGSVPTRAGSLLANAAQLAFSELRQAEMEIAEMIGRGELQITVGGMPLSRSYLLPSVISRFQEQHPEVIVRVQEGPYQSLLTGLRRGEIDLLIGALRTPMPAPDVEQEWLFDDELAIVAGPEHPLCKVRSPELADAVFYPWVVPPTNTPAWQHIENFLGTADLRIPIQRVETSSMILMRELLLHKQYLGCISQHQAASEIRNGLLVTLPFQLQQSRRRIGLTTRSNWRPTVTQSSFMELLRSVEPQQRALSSSER